MNQIFSMLQNFYQRKEWLNSPLQLSEVKVTVFARRGLAVKMV